MTDRERIIDGCAYPDGYSKVWRCRGKAHTKERVYQVMVGKLLDYIEYQEKGEWPM